MGHCMEYASYGEEDKDQVGVCGGGDSSSSLVQRPLLMYLTHGEGEVGKSSVAVALLVCPQNHLQHCLLQ